MYSCTEKPLGNKYINLFRSTLQWSWKYSGFWKVVGVCINMQKVTPAPITLEVGNIWNIVVEIIFKIRNTGHVFFCSFLKLYFQVSRCCWSKFVYIFKSVLVGVTMIEIRPTTFFKDSNDWSELEWILFITFFYKF